jgi:hypothetical protein
MLVFQLALLSAYCAPLEWLQEIASPVAFGRHLGRAHIQERALVLGTPYGDSM